MEQEKLAIRSLFLRQVFDYWSAQRRGRRLPRRTDIDPNAIKLALPHIFLVEVERTGDIDFVFRVAGTFLEAAFHEPLTRKHVTEMKLDDHKEEIVAQYRRVVAERRPILSRHHFTNEDNLIFDYERLLLPLAVGDDERVDMILGAVCFDSPVPTPRLGDLAGRAG